MELIESFYEGAYSFCFMPPLNSKPTRYFRP